MKRQKTKKVNGLLIFSVCLLILAIATPLTLAFFTAQQGGTTNITFGKIELDGKVTTIETKLDTLQPGDKIFEENLLIAKDIFSEDMIVRAKATFTSSSGVASYVGLNGSSLTIQNFLNGQEVIQTTDSGLYMLSGEGNYSSAAGLVPDSDGRTYYVLVGNDPAGPFKGNDGNSYATADEATAAGTTLVTDTVKTVKFVSYTIAVDISGNVYNQKITLGGDAASTTCTLTAKTDEMGNPITITAATGYATGYRWAYNYNDGYYYLAQWGDTNTAETTAEALLNLQFYNIQKSDLLRNDTYRFKDADYDINTLDGRSQLLNAIETSYGVNAKKEALDNAKTNYRNAYSALATALAQYETNNSEENLNSLNSARETYNNNLSAYNTAKTDYYTAVSNLASALGDAQKLFYFISDDTVIPSELPKMANNAQFGEQFTVSAEFNAIQSAYLTDGTVTVAGSTIAAMLTAFTNGDTLFNS